VTEWGCLVADWYGETELGMGDGSVGNITRRSAGTGGKTTLEEVEVVAGCGCGGVGGGDGGLSVRRANNFWGVIFVSVDVDRAVRTPRWGISFSGYEERS